MKFIQNNKITVVDSIMGSGKTSFAIQHMNEHPDQRFIYITPYLSEIERLKEACIIKFYSPESIKGQGKLKDFNKLLQEGKTLTYTSREQLSNNVEIYGARYDTYRNAFVFWGLGTATSGTVFASTNPQEFSLGFVAVVSGEDRDVYWETTATETQKLFQAQQVAFNAENGSYMFKPFTSNSVLFFDGDNTWKSVTMTGDNITYSLLAVGNTFYLGDNYYAVTSATGVDENDFEAAVFRLVGNNLVFVDKHTYTHEVENVIWLEAYNFFGFGVYDETFKGRHFNKATQQFESSSVCKIPYQTWCLKTSCFTRDYVNLNSNTYQNYPYRSNDSNSNQSTIMHIKGVN